MGLIPPPPSRVARQVEVSCRADKMERVMRLVEAQIMGSVDLSPEEIVDQAFNIVELISRKMYEQH